MPGVCIPLESQEHTAPCIKLQCIASGGGATLYHTAQEQTVQYCTVLDCIPGAASPTLVITILYHARCLRTSREPGGYSPLHQSTMHSNAMHKEPYSYKRSPVYLVL